MGEEARRTAEALEGRVVRPGVVGGRYGESGRGALGPAAHSSCIMRNYPPRHTRASGGDLRPSWARPCMKTEGTAIKDIVEEVATEKTE